MSDETSNEWTWSNRSGEQGRLYVGSNGSLVVEVDDDHYSGVVPPEKARELGRDLLLGDIDALRIPTLPLPEDRAEHLREVRKTQPVEYRFHVDGAEWLVPLSPRFTFVRTIIVALGLRLKINPATLSMLIMELSAALVADDLSRDDFLKNAEFWHDSVRLSLSKLPTINTKGGAG